MLHALYKVAIFWLATWKETVRMDSCMMMATWMYILCS